MDKSGLQTSNDNKIPVAIILLKDVTQHRWDDTMANRINSFDDDEKWHYDTEYGQFRVVKVLNWPSFSIKEEM